MNRLLQLRKRLLSGHKTLMGIIYYIDNNNNVYDPQDILDNKINPIVIAKWKKKGRGKLW